VTRTWAPASSVTRGGPTRPCWDDVKKKRSEPDTDSRAGVEQDLALGQLIYDPADSRAGVEQDLALGQLIYDLRTAAGLSQRELAERMATTQSVISRFEEGGGARTRIDTLARVATALDRHLIVSFPEKVPTKLKDAVQVA
jgi:ribosome-binding protein aMBF1 (putative translation factor)